MCLNDLRDAFEGIDEVSTGEFWVAGELAIVIGIVYSLLPFYEETIDR